MWIAAIGILSLVAVLFVFGVLSAHKAAQLRQAEEAQAKMHHMEQIYIHSTSNAANSSRAMAMVNATNANHLVAAGNTMVQVVGKINP